MGTDPIMKWFSHVEKGKRVVLAVVSHEYLVFENMSSAHSNKRRFVLFIVYVYRNESMSAVILFDHEDYRCCFSLVLGLYSR